MELSALLSGITSKNNGDFYCLNCLHFFGTKSKLESHKTLCEYKDFHNILMPFEGTNILSLINTAYLIKHHLLFLQILNL